MLCGIDSYSIPSILHPLISVATAFPLFKIVTVSGEFPLSGRGREISREQVLSDERLSAYGPWRTVPRPIPRELRTSESLHSGQHYSCKLYAVWCSAYLRTRTQGDDPDPELMVSDYRQESPEIHQYIRMFCWRFHDEDAGENISPARRGNKSDPAGGKGLIDTEAI